MKKLNLIILLLPALLCSCGPDKSNEKASNLNNQNTGPLFVYNEPEESAINVSKKGVEIVSVEVTNVPDAGIKIADWDSANVKLHVKYDDATTEDFPLLVKHLPINARHYLGELGHHNIEIMVNGHSTKFGFNIIKNDDFKGYKCEFIDAYSEGKVYETTVGYYQNVSYGGPLLPDHPAGTEFFRSFVGWDYPLENVHQDMTYNAVYQDVEKRYYGDNVAEGQSHVVSTYKDEDSGAYHVLSYLGHMHRVTINYGKTIYHKKGDEAKELSFYDLSLYNERWMEINNNAVKYGLNYSFDNTVGQYLFGTNNAFGGTGSTFLSAFESMYSANTYDTVLETGESYTTSPYPNHKYVYAKAGECINDKRTVESSAETGYYRMAAVLNFDIYLSFSVTKLANGKYELGPSSKFLLSPIVTSLDVLAQYSRDEEFGNNFTKKLEYSNKMFYDIALGLDWGN